MHNRILALKQKHEDDKVDFEDNLWKLKDQLNETDSQSKKMRRSMMNEDAPSRADKKKDNEYESSAKLIDKWLKKWSQNNKDKKALMDKYIWNVKIIEDAFDQIKE